MLAPCAHAVSLRCMVAVRSKYYIGGLKEWVRFIRAGTLDNPDRLPPDGHFFTPPKSLNLVPFMSVLTFSSDFFRTFPSFIPHAELRCFEEDNNHVQ